MNEPHDPNRTVEVPSTPADSPEAGLAAGFGPPRSQLWQGLLTLPRD